jgi:hypothetical protein
MFFNAGAVVKFIGLALAEYSMRDVAYNVFGAVEGDEPTNNEGTLHARTKNPRHRSQAETIADAT